MAASRLSSSKETETRCESPESISSNLSSDASSSNAQSSSFTPPTSVADSTSISSQPDKVEEPIRSIFNNIPIDDAECASEDFESSNRRPQRTRKSILATYNLTELCKTNFSSKKARKIEEIHDGKEDKILTRRRTISGDTLIGSLGAGGNASTETIAREASKLVEDGIEALDLPWSVKKLPKLRSAMRLGAKASPSKKTKSAAKEEANRRRSLRSTNEEVESFTKKLSVLGKRSRGAIDEASAKIKRELKRLADTNEFAKIETKPVIHEVWSCGKLVTGDVPPPKKKAKVDIPEEKPKEPEPEAAEKEKYNVKREKKWLNKGLYAGQENIVDLSAGYTAKERKAMAKANTEIKGRSILPLPIWAGWKILDTERDFKLPYDVCCPLPPGQPKPDEWKKTTKNRFVGDAAALWKKSKVFGDFNSRCVCTKETGCGESCHNRMMLYECDDENCSVGREHCGNRAFADLQERRSKGGKYRVGVEVIKTEDCGYGVRANRCFYEGQIIVEYTGEIITEMECDRRMNEEYRNNHCYYLMLFDQNMIIDATRGSIARFVNHSCEPNCEMVKWIVRGKPRMALFAGKKPIMTGEELTYDYNFDPFSTQNMQECRCGSKNCRGVLGPKPQEPKVSKSLAEGVTKAVKGAVSAGKRKLKELLSGEKDDNEKAETKKRKIAIPVNKSTPAKALAAAKTVARRVSMSVKASTKRGNSIIGRTPKPKSLKQTIKTYGSANGLKQAKLSSRNSSLTIVAHDEEESAPKDTPKKDNGRGLTAAQRDAAYETELKRFESGVLPKSVKKIVVLSIKKRTPKLIKKSPVKNARVSKSPEKQSPGKKTTPKKSSMKKTTPKKSIRVVTTAADEAD